VNKSKSKQLNANLIKSILFVYALPVMVFKIFEVHRMIKINVFACFYEIAN
jgi:hypothetical protein